MIDMVASGFCFFLSLFAALNAVMTFVSLGPFSGLEHVAVAQRWTMIAGFFSWFGYNLWP